MSPRRCSQRLPASGDQQTRWNNCVADDTDGTDCWRRTTGGGRSVAAGVIGRSNQNSNWMWWAYRLSDSSWHCHSVANSTADWHNGRRQSYHWQHTLHELRALRFSKIHSTVDLYSTTSELKASRNRAPRWQFEHSSSHVTSRRTAANRLKQVNTELPVGPFCMTRPDPSAEWPNPTQPNTTNKGAYSLVVAYFNTKNLSCTFRQPTWSKHISSLNILKQCHYVIQIAHKLFKEMFKMSSVAAQKASTKSFQILILLL